MESGSKIFNVVVIGIGLAGRVRIRDLKEAENSSLGLKLVGFVSRRSLDIDGVPQLSLESAVSRPDVDAVAICTEPGKHEEYIRKALDNKKHILVEYPIALSASKAKEFYTEAKEKGLVLHEENIGLLTDEHKRVKTKALESPFISGEVKLKGNYNSWIEEIDKLGIPFVITTSLIQTAYDITGKLKAVSASFEMKDSNSLATAEVETKSNKKIVFTTERFKEKVARIKSIRYMFEDGDVIDTKTEAAPKPQQVPLSQQKKKGLFMQDLYLFAEKLRGERPVEEDVQRSINCLEVADDLNKFAKDRKEL